MSLIYRNVKAAIKDSMPQAMHEFWNDITRRSFQRTRYEYTKQQMQPKRMERVSVGYAKAMSKNEPPTVAKYEAYEIEQWRYRKIEVKETVKQRINPITDEVVKEEVFEDSRKIIEESEKPIINPSELK